MIHLGLQGDLPALTKVGSFTRSYSRVPRTARGKSAGICFLCLAGCETKDPIAHYEDFSPRALWHSTYLTELPYNALPIVLRGLPWGPAHEGPWFFKHDFWHNWHNGVAKIYVASSFVEINLAGMLPGNSIDSKFSALTEEYKKFCKTSNISPYIKALSRETFGMESSKTFPCGTWNKASVSTELMLFLGDFCTRHIENKTDDVLLLTIVAGLDSVLVACCIVASKGSMWFVLKLIPC